MNRLLSRFFIHSIEGTQPRIVRLDEPIRVAAMSVATDTKRIYRDVPKLAGRYEEYKELHGIPNRTDPWAFVAVSLEFDEGTGSFTYMLGDVVNSFEGLPSELRAFEIPVHRYAVFPIRPKNRFGWGFAIGSAKEYAYKRWLPSSEYEQGRVIDDFEYHDARSARRRGPEIDLYVCIKRKSGPAPAAA